MSHSILFVDDEVASRVDDPAGDYMWYYSEACREAGFKVYEARSVDDALTALKAHRDIGLAIVDLVMPPGKRIANKVATPFETGVEFAVSLQRRFPSIAVIILTNAMALANVNRLRKLKCVQRVLFKPRVTPFALVSIIREVLGLVPLAGPPQAAHSPDTWKALLDAKKQKAFATFLEDASKLTEAEFFLLSDVSHNLMRNLLADVAIDPAMQLNPPTLTLEQLFSRVETERDSLLKGKLLEELTARLFETIPGFVVKTRLRSRTEEMDVFILNGSDVAPWRDMGPAMLGECKKWSKKCGPDEYGNFVRKVQNRRGQCKCGFFISWNGFTRAFVEEDLRSSRADYLVLRLERRHLREAIARGDFKAVITNLWQEALQT